MVTDSQLVQALGARLHATNVGVWGNGPFTSSDVAVVYGPIPDSPDRAIGITPYAAVDGLDHVYIRRVQVRFRGTPGAPASADDLADAAFAVLHRYIDPAAGLALVRRVASAQLGPDAVGRPERTDTYQLTINT